MIRCASLRELTSPTKAVKEVLGYKEVRVTKAMNEGLIQEPIIMKEYIKEKERNGSSISVQNCGFFVSPTHGFLGASPDGIVSEMKDSSESSGLLEMKYIQTNDSESLEDALLRKKICVQAPANVCYWETLYRLCCKRLIVPVYLHRASSV